MTTISEIKLRASSVWCQPCGKYCFTIHDTWDDIYDFYDMLGGNANFVPVGNPYLVDLTPGWLKGALTIIAEPLGSLYVRKS